MMKEPQTEAQKSAQKIKQMILSGKYCLNESLPQRKIARKLGVSSIVIRESLRMLERERLVEIVPKWGARVTTFRIEKVRGMSVVREALEGIAARLLAEKITEYQVISLHKPADKVDSLFADIAADRKEVAEVHYSLHVKIVQLSGYQELSEAVEQINLQHLLWINSEVVIPTLLSQPPGWHRRLIDVIAEKIPGKAEEFMRFHVRKGFQDILNSLKEKGSYTEEQESIFNGVQGCQGPTYMTRDIKEMRDECNNQK